MLRVLLAQRFQLALHTEQKPEDIYRLVVRKGGANDDGQDAIIDELHSVGLDLVKEKATLDYLVVDRAEPVSEN